MTAPFTAAREAALKEEYQSAHLALLKQWVDDPQFFCCISGNTVGVDKDPVPVLAIADRVVCVGDPVTVDFSLSWSPTDFLAGTPYTVHWGDGATTNGNFPNPRNPALENETYGAGYAAVGFYDITIDVVDTLGATASTKLQVYARDCTLEAANLPFPVVPAYAHLPWLAYGEIVAANDEVYYTLDISAGAPVWTMFAGGAIGGSVTEIQSMMLELESNGDEHLYMVDASGIWEHPMPPNAGVWTQKQTATQIVAASGTSIHPTDTPWLNGIAISITEDGHQWVTWSGIGGVGGGGDYIVGLAATYDGWNTIAFSVEVTRETYQVGKVGGCFIWGVDINQDNQGQSVYVATSRIEDIGVGEQTDLYKSINGGRSWTLVDTIPEVHYYPDVCVAPGSTGSIVYWGNWARLRRSMMGGVTWATVAMLNGTTFANNFNLAVPIDDNNVCTITLRDELWEFRAGTMVHITPDLPGGAIKDFRVMVRDTDNFAYETLIVGGTGVNSYIKINTLGGQQNKEGGWADPYPFAIGLPELREYAT